MNCHEMCIRDRGKGLDIQISANGSYRKMNKDGKAWTARLSHVVYRMTPIISGQAAIDPIFAAGTRAPLI